MLTWQKYAEVLLKNETRGERDRARAILQQQNQQIATLTAQKQAAELEAKFVRLAKALEKKKALATINVRDAMIRNL